MSGGKKRKALTNTLNELIYGDCLDVMESMDEKSVDFILTDPPYGMTAQKWDSILPFDEVWSNFNRIIKDNGVIAVFSCQPFTTKLISSNSKKFKYCWYWMKNQGTNFFHAKRMPIRKVEEICIFGGKRYYPQITDGHVPTNDSFGSHNGEVYHGTRRRNYKGGHTTRYPTNILDFKCVDNYSRLHPSEKPVLLLEYLINTYSQEGDIVLDPCMGAGSTAIAAMRTGRNYIGIENDENYLNISQERIDEERRKA